MKSLYILFILLLLASCKQADKRDTTKEQADALNDVSFKADDLQANANFIVKIYEQGLFEMKSAQLADSVSHSIEIKSLAKIVSDDYGTIKGRLTDIASLNKIILPDSLGVEKRINYNNLLSTKSFDKDYIRQVMKGNEETLAQFESMKTATTDTNIVNMINEMTPKLNEHMKRAAVLLK
ncbi:hypothetical protein D3C80_873680 [compost metagenome]